MNLTESLLASAGLLPAPRRASAPPQRQFARPPVPPARRASPPPPAVREDARRPTLRKLLSESVRNRDAVTLTPSEARAVLRIMEELERDPFVQKNDAFTTDDLGELGVDMETDIVSRGGDGQPQEDESPADALQRLVGARGPSDLIDPSLAVTAPEATPVEDAAPPPEIAGAMQAFVDEPEVPALPAPGAPPSAPAGDDSYMDAAMRLVNGGADDDGDDGLGSRTPKADPAIRRLVSEAASAPEPEGVVLAPAATVATALAEGRRKMAEEKAARKANARKKSA